jgi:hypothetical protein
MPRGALVNGALAGLAGFGEAIVLCHMRRHADGAKVSHVIGGIVGFVLTDRDAAAGGTRPTRDKSKFRPRRAFYRCTLLPNANARRSRSDLAQWAYRPDRIQSETLKTDCTGVAWLSIWSFAATGCNKADVCNAPKTTKGRRALTQRNGLLS